MITDIGGSQPRCTRTCRRTTSARWSASLSLAFPLSENGEVLLRGVGTLRYLFSTKCIRAVAA